MKAAATLAALACVGCAPPHASALTSLAGTHWSLRSIQSMDDSQGTTHVDDPSRVTLHFGADGGIHEWQPHRE